MIPSLGDKRMTDLWIKKLIKCKDTIPCACNSCCVYYCCNFCVVSFNNIFNQLAIHDENFQLLFPCRVVRNDLMFLIFIYL